MYNISSSTLQAVAEENFHYQIVLDVTFSDNSTLQLTNEDILYGGVEFEDAVSGSSEFQIGSAIINKLTVSLNNIDDTFTDYDFTGAVIVAYIYIVINESTSEYYRRGTYIVDSASGYNTGSINLECLDYMSKFDKPYGLVNTVYPASLQTIVQNICTTCGVTLLNSNFYNNSYTVATRPADDALTCRQVLAYAAQIACSFAICDAYGRLTLKWYNTDEENGLVPVHNFTSIYSITSGFEEIKITGVRVTEEFPESGSSNRAQQYLYGVEGYVLDISGNELIQQGKAQVVAEAIGQKVINTSFYTIDAKVVTDPSVEIGDVATITDRQGTLVFPITLLTFPIGNSMTVQCNAVSPNYRSATQYSEITKALVKAKQSSAVQLSAYDRAMQQLTDLMSESFGVFKTEQVQQDGSIIYILHNKPELADSSVQWKISSNGLVVSTDGGETWNAGIDSSGNAVVNVLSAIGVNADWIDAGKISITGPNNETLFIADYDTGSVYISGDNVFIGDSTASDVIAQLSGALTIVLSNETQGIPVDADGDYSNFPNVSTDIQVLYGSTNVTDSCTFTYSAFNINGTMTDHGTYYTYTPTALNADTGYVSFTAKYNPGTGQVQTSKRFNLYKVYAGAAGPSGQDASARMYFIQPSATVIKQGQDNAYIPSTMTFYAYYRDGNTVTKYAYEGLFQVEETTDGVTWDIVEYPVENKTYTTYTPSANNIVSVRCTLYSAGEILTTCYGLAAGDLTTVITDDDGSWFQIDETYEIISGGAEIDTQTVAVVKDVSALSQEQIFNILTNDGETQGIYLYNNKVYLNATYIATGVIRSNNNTTYWDLSTGQLVMGAGTVGGFTTDSTSVRYNAATSNTDNSIALSTADFTRTIGGTARSGLRFALGSRFGVTGGGKIYASEAVISGAITATSLSLGSGVTIPYSSVSSTPDLTVYIQKNGTVGSTPAAGVNGFKVSSAGVLTASNVIIYGSIYATNGTIGGWTIDSNSLRLGAKDSTADNAIAFSTTNFTRAIGGTSRSNLRFAMGGKFGVTGSGILYASDAVLSGSITASSGTIGGWKIGSISLSKLFTYNNYDYQQLIQAPASYSSNYIALGLARRATGSSDAWEYLCSLTYDGSFKALKATIQGSITATSLTLTGNATVPAAKITGTLSVGGSGNAGVIKLYNSSGQEKGTWNNEGININSGKFKVDLNGNCTATSLTAYGQFICYESA